MTFLIIPIDNHWEKFNSKEEWETEIAIYSPHDAPSSNPEKYPCWAKKVDTIINYNGPDYMVYDFLYNFEEKEVKEDDKYDNVFFL